MFIHRHQVQFYETDLMGIVHHSNYLRFFEEARVGWAHHHGLLNYQKAESASHLAVYETQVKHVKPTFFGDVLEIEVQAKSEGNRILFQYRLRGREGQVCALGQTVHVPLDGKLKIIRVSQEFKNILEKEKWIETWL